MSTLAIGQAFGRVPRQWTADSIALSPVIHDQRRTNATHAHEAAFVTLMLGGEYRETAALRSVQFDRFSAVYHPRGVEHQDFIGASGVQLLMFEFRPDLLDGLPVIRSDAASLRDISGSRAAWEMLSLYRDAQTDSEPLDFEARALQLVGRVAPVTRSAPRDPQPVRRAREYLDAHFRDRVRMQELAPVAGVHPVYLGQMFRRDVGETIASYVNRLRVRAAAEQLTNTDTPLAEIAFDHGFCDQSHFHRVFKKLSGMTPADFRSRFFQSAAQGC